ncbi:MAG: methionine--tRNA ligase [Candidatus Woesearchaeota archaeon]
MKTIVTSALPYVNNIPHLGTLVCVISADVYARYLKLKGEDVISVLGTDEHGTTAEARALEEGISPKELVDKYFKQHTIIYSWFGCNFDCYGRTSSNANHLTTIEIFEGLKKNGFIFEQEIEQLFCEKCLKFLADRFVEGICPFCAFPDARGDQCDNCGKLINPVEIVKPRCKFCKSMPVVRKTTHLFIDLPKLEPELTKWINLVKVRWSANARTMTDAWLKEGLKPRAITRDIKWGIPVPGYEGKVFYSWFDAPIGYISITRESRQDWESYWKDKKTRLVQFMGKDNIPFHTILFPAFLIGSKQGYTLLDTLSVNEYLNYEGGKFSKSRNIGVFGDDAMNSGLEPDVFRYYLMVNRPENSDTEFAWKDFQEKINNELVANLGNLVNRTLAFIYRFYGGVVPVVELDNRFIYEVNGRIKAIEALLGDIKLKDALREIMLLSKRGNQYFQEHEPWRKIKDEPKEADMTIATLALLVKQIGIIISPFLPETSKRIMYQMGFDRPSWSGLADKVQGINIKKPEVLFRKLEDKEVLVFQERFNGRQSPSKNSFPLDLRVARIIEAADHPNAEKLIVLKVDIGTEKRQVVAGLKAYYTKEQLIGRKIVVVANLMPAVLRGVESRGMLLAADDGQRIVLLSPKESNIGDSVIPEGMQPEKSMITIEQFQKNQLIVKNKKVLCGGLSGVPLKTKNEEIIVDIEDGAKVR